MAAPATAAEGDPKEGPLSSPSLALCIPISSTPFQANLAPSAERGPSNNQPPPISQPKRCSTGNWLQSALLVNRGRRAASEIVWVENLQLTPRVYDQFK